MGSYKPRRAAPRSRGVQGLNEYAYAVAVKVVLLGVSVLESVAVARYLGPTLKGQLAYEISLISALCVVISFGLFDSYAFYRRRLADDSELDGFRQDFVSILVILYCGLLLVACIVLAVLSLAGSGGSLVVRLAILTLLWSFSLNVGYVFLIEKPNVRNSVFMFVALAEAAYMLVVWFVAPKNYWIGLSSQILIQVLQAGFSLWFLRVRIRWPRHLGSLLWKYLRFGFFPMVAVLLTTLNYSLDVLMLRHSGGVSVAAIGIYSLGAALSDKVMSIGDAVREVLTSRLGRGAGPGETASVMRQTFAVMLVCSMFIIALGKPFFELFYGHAYNGSYVICCVCVIGTSLMVFFKLIAQYNVAIGKQQMTVWLLGGALLVNVGLNLIFIPMWGTLGAAFATSLSYGLCAAMFLVYFSVVTGIPVRGCVVLRADDVRSALSRLKGSRQ